MTHRSIISFLGLGTLLVLQLGNSCDTDVNVREERRVHREPERVYVEPPPPREEVHVYREQPREEVRVYEEAPRVREDVRVYEEDRGTSRDRSRLPAGIPRGSELVKDEKGKIRWSADESGTFYLYDVNKDFVRYSGPVRRGQEVIVMPGDDIIYVDQRAVSHENLQHDNRHRIYFARGLRDNVTESDRGEGRRTGGAGDPGRTIPKGSTLITQGRGDLVINSSKRQGTIYIYDEDSRNVIYTADLDKGNSFKLNVNNGVVYVNSKKFATVSVPRGHTLSLYMSGH